MKRALWLMCCAALLGCSAAASESGGGGGSGASPTIAGNAGSSPASGSGGTPPGGGSGGSANAGGAQPSAGTNSVGGSAGATNGGSGGASGGASAGAGGASGCSPNPSGALGVVGDTVHDAKTCLDWMKTTKTGVNYAAAEMFCSDSTLGGFDDWRIPSASELASTVTLCGKYPPDGPIDTKLFDQQGDGYWTTTPAGEPNKVCAIGMLNAGGYYHYGTAGPQVVRCVRGAGSVKMVKDCTPAQGCMSW
jgi:hypothetical protein